MKSLIIGIARTGSSSDFVLNPGNRYISMCGGKPEVDFSINCGQHQFNKEINGLRYDDADPSSSAGAISFFQDLVTRLFDDIKYLQIDEADLSPLHIRLVTTPFELAQLPFEFALAPGNIAGGKKLHLLAHPDRKITLTREVRQESEARYVWPSRPRILFAWAQPGGADMSVPHDEHFAVLKSIVAPKAGPRKGIEDPQPFFEELLTALPNASLQDIQKKLAEGIAEERPYTHLHILAHGGEADVYGSTEFRLILCQDGTTDKPQKIDGARLAGAVVPADRSKAPAVVSLSVCDSGHVGNTITPSGSLVYQLHTAGIPCVFASQFPLTQQGSVTLVDSLYRQLISDCDPRTALYEARMELKKEPTHDWASLVAYARFPEDINEQLQDAKLKTLFGSMNINKEWVEHVFELWDKMPEDNKAPALEDLESRLEKSIDGLAAHLDPKNSRESLLANELLKAEHFGLLGSACKRNAEYFFRLMELHPERSVELQNLSREALNKAREFYNCGFEANPESHWTSMQYLSLKAVTEGSLQDKNDIWHMTRLMAEREERNARSDEDRMWAWGTLAELFLLRPLTFPQQAVAAETGASIALAKGYVQKMAAMDAKYNAVKESTLRQLERYSGWWPHVLAAGYPGWLKDGATEIARLLPPLSELLPVR